MTLIEFDMLLSVLGFFAYFASIFVLTTLNAEQGALVFAVRLFVSLGLFWLYWRLPYAL